MDEPARLENQTASLAGRWEVTLADGTAFSARVPGTLDENGIGGPDNPGLTTRLTRRHVYEGPATFARRWAATPVLGRRWFLTVERARVLTLRLNGRAISAREGTLSTPYVFEITEALEADNRIELTTDNRYLGLPCKAILDSSAATDETQTNWNGLLGAVCVRSEAAVFLSALRVYPRGGEAEIAAEIDAGVPYAGTLRVESDAFDAPACLPVRVPAGRSEIRLRARFGAQVRRWDEYDGALHTLAARLTGFGGRQTVFGVRDFGTNAAGRLTLNGRAFFLRGEANCCVFPETGHPPMTKAEWNTVLSAYRAYGANCVRFHSHCPPEAAFAAADEQGMLLQPELSNWDPKTALESDEAWRYYREELAAILRTYANHPSFVMLSLGNELHANDAGVKRMRALVGLARSLDPTRLYATGSNAFYGVRGPDPADGFYTASGCKTHMLRAISANGEGFLNNRPPDTRATYDPAMDAVRATYAGPVFGFEVGQYEVLPDFAQIEDFQGVTQPNNLCMIRDRAQAAGLLPRWRDAVAATGELALLCYRAEVEAVLRTPRMSGLSLLGLQDFPGQGTALVGMLDNHLRPKPYPFAEPKRFAAFFTSVLPLAVLPAYTFTMGERVTVGLNVANYGRVDLDGPLRWRLTAEGFARGGASEGMHCPAGALTDAGTAAFVLPQWDHAAKFTLRLSVGEHHNEYPLWAYPAAAPAFPPEVHIAREVGEAIARLRKGERVLYTPAATKEGLPGSVGMQFSTDFWSVGTFPEQEGTMGLLIQKEHPLFERFPTDAHADWQWWALARGRALRVPAKVEPVVAVPDTRASLRRLSLLFECRVGAGRLMVSGIGLVELGDRPEARTLLAELGRYMVSERFSPSAELTEGELCTLLGAPAGHGAEVVS